MSDSHDSVYAGLRSIRGFWSLIRVFFALFALIILDFPVRVQTASNPVFPIATRPQYQMPSVDIKLTGSVTPPTVKAGEEVIFSYTITNQSATTATDVILLKTLPGGTTFIGSSSSSNEEICTNGSEIHPGSRSGEISCRVGTIGSGGSIVLTIRARVAVFGNGFDRTQVEMQSSATATSAASDPNDEDNQLALLFHALPSMNKPPVGRITSPGEGPVYVTSQEDPVSIPVSITATDADGSVSAVRVYDTGEFAGIANRRSDGSYTFNFTTVRFGYHILTAQVEDNEGRLSMSDGVQFLVNSPHTISITQPTGQLVTPGTSTVVEARSGTAESRVQKIELYNDGILVGTMRAASNTGNVYTYRLNWPSIPRGRHSLVAVLTDLNSATTISETVEFTATVPPTVRLTSPRNEQSFAIGSDVTLTAAIEDADGFVRKTEFVANGNIIADSNAPVKSGQISAQWISPREGVYSVVVRVTDDLGVTTISDPVKIIVGRRGQTPVRIQ